MENVNETIEALSRQESALHEQMLELERTVASSAPGIREFRRTRLRQLQSQHASLSERLRRLQKAAEPIAEAYRLHYDLRGANRIAAQTFVI